MTDYKHLPIHEDHERIPLHIALVVAFAAVGAAWVAVHLFFAVCALVVA